MFHLNDDDIVRLQKACESYKDSTGSEYMWDVYTDLQNKLRIYREQNLDVHEDTVSRRPDIK